MHVVGVGNKSSNFLQLRAHQFHFSKSTPPTSQELTPYIYRAFFNAYTAMHVLDRQLNIRTTNLDSLDNVFALENGNPFPTTSWKSLEPRWNVVCHCGKCARVTCPCRVAMVCSSNVRRQITAKILITDLINTESHVLSMDLDYNAFAWHCNDSNQHINGLL